MQSETKKLLIIVSGAIAVISMLTGHFDELLEALGAVLKMVGIG